MREIKIPCLFSAFMHMGFVHGGMPEGYPLCGGWVCTLKTSYPFTKHIPVVIVMSVSHVSRYAKSWMGIGAAESHRKKGNGLRLYYPRLRSGKYRAITARLLLAGR